VDYLLKEIDVFVKIIDLGSFKAAAEELNLTQSAMTQRLKRLEDALGVRLVDRTTRSVAPTAVGRDFLPTARRMVLQFEQSMADLQDLIQVRTGQVTIASLISAATYILPIALERFGRDHPNVNVRILDDVEQVIATHVRRGEADFGMDMQTSEPSPGLTMTPLLSDRYVVACRPEHALASRRSVSWNTLADLPLVLLGARSGTNRLLVSHLAGVSYSNKWRYEVQHLSTLIGMVEAGVGVGIVPELAMRARSAPRLVQRRLVDPDFTRTIVLVERQATELSPAAEKLKSVVVETFQRAARRKA
jgi:DNA-binding transcriptional LysR family regulator